MAAKKTFDAIPRDEAMQAKWGCEISPRPDLYDLMDELVSEHHEDLYEARIVICWKYGWEPDDDGILHHGKLTLVPSQDVQLHGFDFKMSLNYEVWSSVDFTPLDQRILVDHELCHGRLKRDKDGQPCFNANTGRLKYRIRRHDYEEFSDITKRYGISSQSVVAHANSIMQGVKANRQMAIFETLTGAKPNIQLVKPGPSPRLATAPAAPIELPDLLDLLRRAQPERGWTLGAVAGFTAAERQTAAAWARNYQDSPAPPEVSRQILEDLDPFERQEDLATLLRWVDISPGGSGDWPDNDLSAVIEWALLAHRFDRGESGVHVPLLPQVLAPDVDDVVAIAHRFSQSGATGLSRAWLLEHLGSKYLSVAYVFDALQLTGALTNTHNGHYQLADDEISEALVDAVISAVMVIAQRKTWQAEGEAVYESTDEDYAAAGYE